MKKKSKVSLFLAVFVIAFSLFGANVFSAENDVLENAQTLSDGEMTKSERLRGTVYFQNLNYGTACDGVLTVINSNDKSVMPKMHGEKLYVPLRFVLEYYGVCVSWEHESKTVVITANQNVYRLCVPESSMMLGERMKKLSNPCYIEKGTTFVALDDLPNIVTCSVKYFPEYQSGVVFVGEDWKEEREAERQALSAMEFAVSPFFKMFV